MKPTRFATLLAAGLALSFAAVGCKHTPVGVTPIPNGPQPIVGEPGAGAGNALGTGAGVGSGAGGLAEIAENPPGLHAGWIEHPNALKADTVYFDFDSAVVKDSQQPKVAEVASYLNANPSAAVRVEGNCDERGTEEYNRALGERRALAVRADLVGLGVDPTRVDTISYGKDRPADPGHNEAAWAKNRRDDFVVLTPPQSQ